MNVSGNAQKDSRRAVARRPVAAVSIVLAGLVLLLGSSLMGSPSAGATGAITVTETPLAYEGPCVPSALARTSWVPRMESTSAYFRVVFDHPETLCDPIDAVAVVYGMPGNGVAWPQALLSSKAVLIKNAGTTEITFAKDCQPAQFDVVTGETPQKIDEFPRGPFHGPLLFPVNLETAQQYFPDSEECGPPDTKPTTPPTEPTTPPTQPTTPPTQPTTPAVVGGVTTIKPGPSTTTGGQPVAVLAATKGASDPAGTSLALTGAPSSAMALLGGILLLVGLSLVAVSRRGRSWS